MVHEKVRDAATKNPPIFLKTKLYFKVVGVSEPVVYLPQRHTSEAILQVYTIAAPVRPKHARGITYGAEPFDGLSV